VTTDIPAPPPPEGDGEDELAREENEFVDERPDAPELVAARRGHLLDVIAIRRAFMSGVRIIAYIVPFLGLAMILVWLWHLLLPPSYRWLSDAEINHLQSLLFSGAISALATAIATKKV
jgi:hypothetical protein